MHDIMFSVDTEAMGLHVLAPIVQIGIAAFDINAPPGEMVDSMEWVLCQGTLNNVEPFAAAMNSRILAAIAGTDKFDAVKCRSVQHEYAARTLGHWINAVHGGEVRDKITFCGKNFAGFDLPKLERLPDWETYIPPYHYRSPDPGSMWWVPGEDGATLPDLKTCMERAGIAGEVAHTAEEDAIVVAKLIQIWVQK